MHLKRHLRKWQKLWPNCGKFSQNVLWYTCGQWLPSLIKGLTFIAQHCRKKIGDLLIVSQQIQIIRSSLGIKIAQFVEY